MDIIKNGHIQIYNDKIVIVNAFKNKKVISYVKEETSLMLTSSYERSFAIFMSKKKKKKVIAEYKDYVNRASLYQEPKTAWDIGIKALGLKIIDPQEIIKND